MRSAKDFLPVKNSKFRTEKDSLGEKQVPSAAYYGVETLRAYENFPISGWRFHPLLIKALALVKKACAETYEKSGALPRVKARAVIRAAEEVMAGRLHDQFITDALQSGAGVSLHMNMNEVLANRALEILGRKKGDYASVNPHDDVNKGQSTNDVIPTAMRIATLWLLKEFSASSKILEKSLSNKAREFRSVIKSGRTHLQDAAPITLGQEFSGWARQVEKGRLKAEESGKHLLELGIGGSAVGTGLNTTRSFRREVVRRLKSESGLNVRSAENLFEVMQSDADFAVLSGALKSHALSLIQISNDLRFLSSGPKTGLAEIKLPPRQPGSSIMPGKVNPVMPEAAMQAAFQVVGQDQAISFAVTYGQLELNVMRPVIAHNLMMSLEILKNVMKLFADLCIDGIEADADRCRKFAEESYGIAAALNLFIGYEKAAECVKLSAKSGKTLRQVILEKGYLSAAELDKILSPEHLTQPKK